VFESGGKIVVSLMLRQRRLGGGGDLALTAQRKTSREEVSNELESKEKKQENSSI